MRCQPPSSLIASSGDSEKKKTIKDLPDNFTKQEIEEACTEKLAKKKPATATAFESMWYDIQVAIIPIMAMVDVGMIGYSFITAGFGFSGPPALREVAGGARILLKLLLVGASFPRSMNMPAWGARVSVSSWCSACHLSILTLRFPFLVLVLLPRSRSRLCIIHHPSVRQRTGQTQISCHNRLCCRCCLACHYPLYHGR